MPQTVSAGTDQRGKEPLSQNSQCRDTDPDSSPAENPSKQESSNLLDFQAFREAKRGGGRIRTDE